MEPRFRRDIYVIYMAHAPAGFSADELVYMPSPPPPPSINSYFYRWQETQRRFQSESINVEGRDVSHLYVDTYTQSPFKASAVHKHTLVCMYAR
ncbi:MAG TPA: hypothetical protein VHA09_01670, partial [Nitrososphaera sp.]|nr:hypothetical protein [Nitrososphaera sp.]